MRRDRGYTTTPYTDALMADKRSYIRRKVDSALINVLWFLLGIASTVIYASYYPLF